MNFSAKHWLLGIVGLLLISLAANYYSFSRLGEEGPKDKESVQGYINQLKQKNEEIERLKKEQTRSSITVESNNSLPNAKEGAEQKNEIVNAASHFIEYGFNSDPSTYVTRKQNASNYMTDELVETIFASDGVDEEAMNVRTEVNGLQVFIESDNEEEAVVHYSLSMEILDSGYKEISDNYVKLQFTAEDGQLKVKAIEALNVVGGV